MSVYERGIYPDLPRAPSAPSAPLDSAGHMYRLVKIEEVEQFLRNEIQIREKLAKKFSFWSSVANYIDNGLIFAGLVSAGAGIAVFSTGIGAPIGIGLEALALASGVSQVGVVNFRKKMGLKSQKHESILFCAQTSLDQITSKISKAITDGLVDDSEFQIIMTEKQRYMMEEEKISTKTRKSIQNLSSKEKEQIIEKAKKEEREKIVKNLTSVPPVTNG